MVEKKRKIEIELDPVENSCELTNQDIRGSNDDQGLLEALLKTHDDRDAVVQILDDCNGNYFYLVCIILKET